MNYLKALMLVLVMGFPISAQDVEPGDLRPDIVMYIPDFRCDACTFWKLNMMPKLIEQGHRVLILQRLKLDSYPAFHVLKADGKWSALRQGSMRLDQYRAIVDGKPVP